MDPYRDTYRTQALRSLTQRSGKAASAAGGPPSGPTGPTRPASATGSRPAPAAPGPVAPTHPTGPGARLPATPATPAPGPASPPGLPPIATVTGNVPAGADAQYQAFLRGLGLEEGQVWRRNALTLDQANQNRGVALSDLQIGRDDRLERTGGNYESRGFVRSGERLKDEARIGRDFNRSTADVNRAWAQTQAGVRQSLGEQIAALARQRAEQEMALYGRNELRRAGGVVVPQ